jgi:hypothetical protein
MKPLEITVTADTEQAQKELKAVGTVSDTAGSKVESSMRSAQDSIDETGRSASNAADKTKDLGDAAGDTATNAGKLAGALDLVHPAAGDVARIVADAADSVEVLSKVLTKSKFVTGTLAVALAAAGAAYLYLKKQINDAEVAQEEMSEAATAAEGKFASLKTIVSGLADELLVLNGASQAGIDLEQQQAEINAEYQTAIRHLKDQIAARRELRQEVLEARDSSVADLRLVDSTIQSLEDLIEKTEKRRDVALEAAAQISQARAQEITDAAALQEAEEARRAAAAAAAAADSARSAAASHLSNMQLELMRAQGDEMGVLDHLYQQEIAAIDEMAAAAAAAGVVIDAEQMKQIAKQKHLIEVEKLQEEQFQAAQDAKIEATAAEAARLEELAALEIQIAAEREVRDQEAHELAMERLEERRSELLQTIGSSSELMGSLSEGFQMMADSQAAANSQAAMKTFEIAKKLAIAEVVFNLASGIMEAALLPPIAREARIASLGVTSGIQLALIGQQEPPTAHMGDTGFAQRMHMGGTADSAGQQTVILRNEAVLDSATTRRLGPDGVQSLLNGAGAGPGRASKTVVTYRHLDQAVGDLLKNNGSRSAKSAKSAARSASSIGTTRAYQ